MQITGDDAHRFWIKADCTNDAGCWPWRAGCRAGYGAFKLNGVVYSAHRLAYILTNGEIVSGGLVCHRCNNRLCVNPAHLYIGSTYDNVRDMILAGSIHVVSPEQHAKGERVKSAVLTELDVSMLRLRYTNRRFSGEKVVDLLREFNIGKSTLYHIINRDTWRHI